MKVKDIVDVQCLKLWYEFINNESLHLFKFMFTCNHEPYEMKTRSRYMLHLYLTRTEGVRNV